MTVQPAYLDFPIRNRATESFGRPKCPRCGSVLLMAEESRFNVRGRIDHAWSCDECGNEFVTSIRLLPR
jgi:ribosomal protein S27AE